ncbi:ABC transporter ATP-binding protein [Mesoplasma photuris]|uniref:ABC transporter ATP-binding protein n=1 Tax=Mesoplasma photuris TaxID=217731 RepID=UPI0004E15387|nr:ATP-binding cassette domain-containing protein [Mesoplasma photuris]
MIKINNITKKYSETSGNFDINLNIKEGECYGIVGPNGAGKTTLIRQLLGFIKPDSGEIKINNIDTWKNREEIMNSIGYVAGEISLYDDMTGLAYLKLNKNLKDNVDWLFVENLLKHFDIDGKTKIKKMSKGMKQKIAIIAAVMNKPKILVLDEPTSGLDPVMQDQFNDLVIKMKNEYKSTIIICSHIFEEVSILADKVIILKDGKLIEKLENTSGNLNMINEKFKSLFEKEKFI